MNKKALVCDDDEGILDVISLVLENVNIQSLTETNSLNIYERVEQEKPDIILIDLWMPGLGGDEVTKTLKNNPETKNIPVVIISASREGKKIARESGAEEFIRKPFDINNLVTTISHYL
ncbi:response regulator [Foetidibacter luteolus]|uniref:response regulator n=1 Tax=Foetidibacter luteolus TaxID=2608880 RepID=UPI00129AB279|nr:response regulator [Foetidibacter luteolus]